MTAMPPMPTPPAPPPSTPNVVERHTLAPGLTIARALTGLWQIADMERDGRSVDPAHAADAMRAYVDAGLTTFDMADLRFTGVSAMRAPAGAFCPGIG